jgi:hypothetical protein
MMVNRHFFEPQFIVKFVPAPTVMDPLQYIANYIYQSANFRLYRIEWESPQTVDKQMLFYPGFKMISQVQKLGLRCK